MKLHTEKIINYCSRYIPYPKDKADGDFEFWKIRILYFLILGLLIFGTLAYIPSLIISILTKVWLIAIVDSFFYLLVIYIGLDNRLSARAKTLFILTCVYLLGMILLIGLGPIGAGFIWLFMFPVLTGILLNLKAVFYSLIINFLSMVLLTVLLVAEWPFNLMLFEYNLLSWIANCVNFLATSFIISVSLSLILSKIDNSLKREKQLTGMLLAEQRELETARKRAEESDKLKSAFVANISHEIRTPMNGILGFADLLMDSQIKTDKQDKYIQLIQHSGQKMLNIINELIDISKIESGQVQIHLEEIDVYKTIDYLNDFFIPLATQKGLFLKTKTNLPAKPFKINTDNTKLTQVLSNLINNALKFTEDGSIKLETRCQDSHIVFSVKDSGIGISEEMKQKVFERFRQIDGKHQVSNDGIGLGLAISKAYVELLNGRIWVESKDGNGSEFFVSLPLDSKH